MNLIVCLDERLGMMFNGRRQSSDRLQIENMRELIGDSELSVSPYTAKLLADKGIKLNVLAEPHTADGYCFIEDTPLPDASVVERLIIYRWGRRYPSDKRFTLDLGGFTLVESCAFFGKSHENIVREIYVR